MKTAARLSPVLALLACLAIAACNDQENTRPRSTSQTVTTRSTESSGSGRSTTPHSSASAAGGTAETRPRASKLPDNTGIAACDDYLASYMACHRAAGIYKPDQLQSRYQAMRTSLLRDSQDDDIRPQLAARCNSLANQLRQALHGKACEATPTPSGSTHGQ